tara:strand:+ start:11322 stop:14264 length:2943 start_codon:yes stop_codon:yes gene_type:complete
MAQPENYTQTILLDANRLSSEEFSASNLAQTNPSVFTNKVSSGITLDIGDQVSIESAHIAQRGAGGDTIEMKGKSLGKKDIVRTEFTNSSYIGFNTDGTSGRAPTRYSPTGFSKQTASNITEEVDMKDNEATIVVEFYKSANGENCFSLPRNFLNASARNASVTGYNQAGGAHFATNASNWLVQDGYPIGSNTFDFTIINQFNSFTEGNIGDYIPAQVRNSNGGTLNINKIKMDNSRFTLFKREIAVYNGSDVSTADLEEALNPTNGSASPATANYVRFKKKVKISVKEGYNTPSNIASQITDQLQETEDPISVVSPVGAFNSNLQNSTLNIGFPCGNYVNSNSSGNKDYFQAPLVGELPIGQAGAPLNTGRSVAYINTFDYVGFKRPDFIEAGRAMLPPSAAYMTTAIDSADALTAVINTDIAFTDDNLLKIKRFFDSQVLYPELLDGGVDQHDRSNYKNYNLTSASLSASFREEARFIHLDTSFENQGAKSADQALGDDMINVSFTSSGVNVSDRSSSPIFVYFNNNSSLRTASETSFNTRYGELAYGFARKIGSGVGTIAFTTELIGGIPAARIVSDIGNVLVQNTKIGYDYHFSAYGNAAIGITSGFSPLQFYGHQGFLNAPYISNTYVGANNALFNFDTVENRFEFQNLHTAEKTGNFYNAGDPLAPGDILAPPPSSQQAEDVFFINKQLRYDSWSPDMQPYSVINLSGTTASDNIQSFIEPNLRFTAASIFDSHGGISIVDMGVTEDKWDQSIWGLLGFRYSQFNPSGTGVKNTNVRFDNQTTNVSGMTTNAEITSVTPQNYTMNAFSINMVKPSMLNSQIKYFNAEQNMGTVETTSASYEVFPAIAVQQTSTSIKATDLPRKILRGYFLVNSDILDQADYYQLSNPLQTMAVVGKYNAATDFVNYDGGGPVFTVTRKKTITDIKTQILDPEGELAQVGDNTGIIYRIDKVIKTDLKFGENLLAGMYGKLVGSS